MKTRLLSTVLAMGLIAGMSIPQVMAEDVQTTQTITDSGSTASCDVTVNGGSSTFTVTVPKAISGTGKSGTLNYEVTVSGDFAGNEQVNVNPDASVTLQQSRKTDVIATISQDKKSWNVDELSTKGAGSITYDGLTSGTWNGSFNFNISLTGENVTLTADNLSTYNISTVGTLVIPSVVKDLDGVSHLIVGIDKGAFANCSELTSVVIPDSVETIGNGAFTGCSNLKSVVLSNSIETIPVACFYNCSSLSDISIPNSVSVIDQKAFRECTALASILIPNGVTSIKTAAFYGCNALTNVVIPDTVTVISDNAFAYCTSLSELTVPDSVTTIADYAFTDVPHITYHGTATGSPWGATSIN